MLYTKVNNTARGATMKPIEINDLFEFSFLSNVKAAPTAERVAFTVTKCDKNQNGYKSAIYLYENGVTRRLTGMDKERSFYWESDDCLLFPAVRSDDDKKRKEKKEVFTAFYRLNIHGGEAERAFELPFNCGELFNLDGDLKYLVASVDMRYPDYYKLSKKQQQAILDEQAKDEDYHVFTRYPWWFNGSGFVEERGSCIFTYNTRTKAIKRISSADCDVDTHVVHNGKLYYTAVDRRERMPEYQKLYCYDPKSDKLSCIDDKEDFTPAVPLLSYHGQLLMMGNTNPPDHGINTNPMLYSFNFDTASWDLICRPNIAP